MTYALTTTSNQDVAIQCSLPVSWDLSQHSGGIAISEPPWVAEGRKSLATSGPAQSILDPSLRRPVGGSFTP